MTKATSYPDMIDTPEEAERFVATFLQVREEELLLTAILKSLKPALAVAAADRAGYDLEAQ